MITKAVDVLKRCETELRTLVSAAAGAGDYDSVVRITFWAKEVAAITADAAAPESPRQTAANAQPAGGRKRGKAAEYPKFVRQGDSLVKIGWSKKDRAEYEHKAAGMATKPLADALIQLGKGKRIFQVAELLPLDGSGDDGGVPDYQVYVLVAWLRSVGLITQRGRQGYSVLKPDSLVADIAAAWSALRSR